MAGKLLSGWVVIDLDGTLITAHSDNGSAAVSYGAEMTPRAANSGDCVGPESLRR